MEPKMHLLSVNMDRGYDRNIYNQAEEFYRPASL